MTKGKSRPRALTERQRRFVESYIATGNATESARRAGYKTGASVTGSRMLKHPLVAAAVLARSEELANASIATAKEQKQFWTSAMRGEIKGATLTERLKASELLAKSIGQFIDRREVKSLALTGTLDWDALLPRAQDRPDPPKSKPDALAIIDATPATDSPAAAAAPPESQAPETEDPPLPRPTSPPQLRLAQSDSLAAASREADRRARDAEELSRKLGL